uniref:Uncharacterized protein n=1 Tax=Babesia bovis TaxID=5865 RepID=S6B9N8_BABBO|nr:hypothetical protein [Babesia bovis]
MHTYLHLSILLTVMTIVLLYGSNISNRDIAYTKRRPTGLKLTELSMPTIKIKLHKSLTLPRTVYQLPNLEKTINIEASRIIDIEKNSTLTWTRNSPTAINLYPSVNPYGLAGLYMNSNNEEYGYTALLRLPYEICKEQTYSWTCQKQDEYDNTYCIVVMQSKWLEPLLKVAQNAAETQTIDITGRMVKGTFCGNPMLQRIAAGNNAVYLLNHKNDPKNVKSDHLLCKYNTDAKELSLCYNIRIRNMEATMPQALIYVRKNDTLVCPKYIADERLHISTFDGKELNDKVMYKPLPISSGFLIHTDSYEGNVIFHGDLSIYEVDTVLNLQTGTDVTISS